MATRKTIVEATSQIIGQKEVNKMKLLKEYLGVEK